MSLRTLRSMPVVLAVVAFATLGLMLVQAPLTAEAAMNAAEQEVLDLINEERVRNGLGSLVATQTLDTAAAWLAADLAIIDGLDHTDTLGRGLRDRLDAFGYPSNTTIRENIAAGYATPASVVAGWINSPGHYTNILAEDANAAGIALVKAPDTVYGYFWVMDFGSEVDTPFPDGTSAPPLVQTVGLTGAVPQQGVGLMTVQESAAPEQIVASVEVNGCSGASVWITQNGVMIGYLADAPTFVNVAFPAALAAGTPFVVSCG